MFSLCVYILHTSASRGTKRKIAKFRLHFLTWISLKAAVYLILRSIYSKIEMGHDRYPVSYGANFIVSCLTVTAEPLLFCTSTYFFSPISTKYCRSLYFLPRSPPMGPHYDRQYLMEGRLTHLFASTSVDDWTIQNVAHLWLPLTLVGKPCSIVLVGPRESF